MEAKHFHATEWKHTPREGLAWTRATALIVSGPGRVAYGGTPLVTGTRNVDQEGDRILLQSTGPSTCGWIGRDLFTLTPPYSKAACPLQTPMDRERFPISPCLRKPCCPLPHAKPQPGPSRNRSKVCPFARQSVFDHFAILSCFCAPASASVPDSFFSVGTASLSIPNTSHTGNPLSPRAEGL